MDYLTLKFIHVVSSVLLVGTGFGSALYLFLANRSGSVAAISVVSRLVVRTDWYITTPAVIIQPVTGVMMMQMAGWPDGRPMHPGSSRRSHCMRWQVPAGSRW